MDSKHYIFKEDGKIVNVFTSCGLEAAYNILIIGSSSKKHPSQREIELIEVRDA